jgi:peroxiredoxin
MKRQVSFLLILLGTLALSSMTPLSRRSLAQRRTAAPTAPPAQPVVRIYQGAAPSNGRPVQNKARQLMPLDQLRTGNFTLLALDGQTVRLADLLPEGQPALVQFWQTSCEQSLAEITYLNDIWDRYHRQGLAVVALTIDDPAQRRNVSAFVKSNRMEYPVYFTPPNLYKLMTGGATGTPQTYLFSRDGRISNRLIGWDSKRGRYLLEQAVSAVF